MRNDLVLANGAEVVEYDASAGVVLAYFRDREYVTWNYHFAENSSEADAYWGHYYGDDFLAAAEDYRARVRRYS